MLRVKVEKEVNEKDIQIINAFKTSINLYLDKDINILWEQVKNCKFQDHNIGRGGSHIWICRKSDNKRVAIIE